MFDNLTETITDIVESLGYLGVAFLIAVESIFPPIPSEAVLPLAGFVAGRGDASLIGMIIAATLGSLVGAWVLYGLAAWIGPVRLHRFIDRHGRWFRLTVGDLERAESWFDRRSDAAVLVGRCIPLIRSIVSIPAGFRRMPLGRFTVLTALGSLVWNGALIGAGAVLGDRWEEVGDVIGLFQTAVIVVVAALVLWLLWKRFIRDRGVVPADIVHPPEEH